MSSTNVGGVVSQIVGVRGAVLREKKIDGTAKHRACDEEAGNFFGARETDGSQIEPAPDFIHEMRGWIPAPGGRHESGVIAIGHFRNYREIVLRVGTVENVAVPQNRRREGVLG